LSEPLHILSVEDNDHTRLLLKHQLSDPHEVTLAPDEEEALEAIESTSFDLLLLDINLQAESGGVDLLRTVRRRDDLPDPPAIALTAFAMPDERQWLLNEGFDAYVGKPFTKANLISTIEETLPQSQTQE
jgi:CheY-like chemotaxis protein